MVGPLPVPELGFAPPAFGMAEIVHLLPAALGVVLLAMPAGILLGRAFAERNHEESDANKELIGIGFAGVLAGLVGGFASAPARRVLRSITQPVRRVKLAGVVAALLMGLFLFFPTKALNHLPAVAVSALIYTGMHLLEPHAMRNLFQLDRAAGWFAVLTAIGVLMVGSCRGSWLAFS